MNTATGLIYGSTSEGRGCAQARPEPESMAGECEIRRESTSEGFEDCEACLEAYGADDVGDGDRASQGNGDVWWTTYVEPDKPMADFTAREVGVHGEALAARYLAKRGLTVLRQNWRSKVGEVDIVARDEDGEIALVEVKTRLDLDGDPQCMPELAVDGRKQRRYRKIALVYLMLHPEVLRMRFDVIAINILDAHNARLRHLVGAFCWDS